MNRNFTKYVFSVMFIFVITFINLGNIKVNAEDEILQVGTDTNYAPFVFLIL